MNCRSFSVLELYIDMVTGHRSQATGHMAHCMDGTKGGQEKTMPLCRYSYFTVNISLLNISVKVYPISHPITSL